MSKRTWIIKYRYIYLCLDNMYTCAYNIYVEVEWDSKKAISNFRKHGIDFADSVSVFDDESANTISDNYPNEERFITLGMDILNRILVVVYTWRGPRIRIISARKATAFEIKQYQG